MLMKGYRKTEAAPMKETEKMTSLLFAFPHSFRSRFLKEYTSTFGPYLYCNAAVVRFMLFAR